MKKLVILTTSTCGRCKKIKPLVQDLCVARGIKYEEFVVPAPGAVELAKQYKVTSAPFFLYYDGVTEDPKEYRNIHDISEVSHMFQEFT